MSVLPIYLYGSEVLKTKAKPVKEIDNSIVKLIYDMFETMEKSNGIGLAANQVGRLQRIVVIDITDVEEKRDEDQAEQKFKHTSPGLPKRLVMINPEVLLGEASLRMEEGCLSIPEVRAEVERAERIKVRFQDANFRDQELFADGLLARVMLHEIDHLDGVLFLDRISAAQRKPLKEQLRKIKKGEIETSYAVMSDSARMPDGHAGLRSVEA